MSYKSFKTMENPLLSNMGIIPDIDLSGCLVWLDGKDPLYTGFTHVTDTYLSEWRDKSGLGNNGVAKIPILYNFTETQYFTGACINATSLLTITAVCSCSSLAQIDTAGRVMSLGLTGINDYNNSKFMSLSRFQSSTGLVAYCDSKYAFSNPPTIYLNIIYLRRGSMGQK